MCATPRRLLQAIAGRDPQDSTSAAAPVQDYAAAMDGNVRGMKIGLPKEYFKGLSSETGDRDSEGHRCSARSSAAKCER